MVEGEDGGIGMQSAPPSSPSVAFGATSPWRGRIFECRYAPSPPRREQTCQIEKLEPQPQPDAACGFSTLNAAPPSDST